MGEQGKKKGGKEKGGKKGKSQKSSDADDKSKTATRSVNVLDQAAMENALNICHNVQVRMERLQYM